MNLSGGVENSSVLPFAAVAANQGSISSRQCGQVSLTCIILIGTECTHGERIISTVFKQRLKSCVWIPIQRLEKLSTMKPTQPFEYFLFHSIYAVYDVRKVKHFRIIFHTLYWQVNVTQFLWSLLYNHISMTDQFWMELKINETYNTIILYYLIYLNYETLWQCNMLRMYLIVGWLWSLVFL